VQDVHQPAAIVCWFRHEEKAMAGEGVDAVGDESSADARAREIEEQMTD
jgi:hypothetical protein